MGKEARLNQKAIMNKNRPDGARLIQVMKLENGLDLIPAPNLVFTVDVDKQEVVCVVIATLLKSSSIIGAGEPVHVSCGEIARIPYETLAKAIRPSGANGTTAEPAPAAAEFAP